MSNQEPDIFSIKCQCVVQMNGLQINNNKKSKLSNLVLNSQLKNISIVPLNSKDESIVFQLKNLKHIYRTCILEGKISLLFSEDNKKTQYTIGGQSLVNKSQTLSKIFVQAGSPQNLQLLITKITNLKKAPKLESKSLFKKQLYLEKEHITQDQGRKTPNQATLLDTNKIQKYPKPQKLIQNKIQKKVDPLRYSQKINQYGQQKGLNKQSRKQLMKQAYSSSPNTEDQQFPTRFQQKKRIFRPAVDILQLPAILLQKILEYTKMQLKHRLVNKKFDKFVLEHMQNIQFKDQIDEVTFNKLAKFTTNIKGRLKNVRLIKLMDRYDDPQLQKNRAKSLYFGEWKQMSKKNVQQLIGLRIHTLEIPYQIKFELSHIRGIRLKQLHFHSNSVVTTQNSLIADDEIIHLFKHVKQLQAFSIPYINSSVLDQLNTNHKQKMCRMKSLRFGSINENMKTQQAWFLLHGYEQIKSITIQRVLKGGLLKKDARYSLTFPLYIQQLELGSFITEQTLTQLPKSLLRLKLIGDQYFNKDIQNIELPYLRVLDLSQCNMVRPAMIGQLARCNNLRMITNWEKQDVLYWKQKAQDKGIQIQTVRGNGRR